MFKLKKNSKDSVYRVRKSSIEKKKKLLQYLMFREELSFNKRLIFFFKFYKVKLKFKSGNKVKNRCVFSGRARGVLSRFRVSRHFFKKFTKKGHFFNVLKR